MNKIKAVLFDFDDTIFDHRYCCRRALKSIREDYDCFKGSTLDEFELEHISILEEVHVNEVLTGKLALDEARAERFRRMFEKRNVKSIDKIEYECAARYRKIYTSSARLVPGAIDLLRRLKDNYKICVVTNNLIAEQKGKIRNCGIEQYIDELVTSEEVGEIKPHPLIFQNALKRMHVNADEAIMIGDKWEMDIVGARNAGIKCIWINIFGTNNPDPSIAYEVSSVGEVEKIYGIIAGE